MRPSPSPYLEWDSICCKDDARTPYPFDPSLAARLGEEYGRVLAAFHPHKIKILSGYRTRAQNVLVGGARRSKHMTGMALDIAPVNPKGLHALSRIVLGIAELDRKSLIRGVGFYPTFVHFDIRPDKNLVFWSGKRTLADLDDDDVWRPPQ
jgi:uncharacterized protein YcbK (DUF882 family)